MTASGVRPRTGEGSLIDSGARPAARDAIGYLEEGGESGTLIRAHDWSQTPLGSIEDWAPYR